MKQITFIKKNSKKWQQFRDALHPSSTATPDEYADLYLSITEDLAYAQTYYPNTNLVKELNAIAAKAHTKIYRNKKEDKSRIINFWRYEIPKICYGMRTEIWQSLLFFGIAVFIGALSCANDSNFANLVLSDSYVSMTKENIAKGDPMGVYKHGSSIDMFVSIALNNIRVSFAAFAMGALLAVGTLYILLKNGIMLGTFQYFFHDYGLLLSSFSSIWIHGALEISAIVLGGAAGLKMGYGILFPKTYTRAASFAQGARNGMKLIVGLIPIFIVAAFLEGYVTRHTEWHFLIRWSIIISSFAFIYWYFWWYPAKLHRQNSVGGT